MVAASQTTANTVDDKCLSSKSSISIKSPANGSAATAGWPGATYFQNLNGTSFVGSDSSIRFSISSDKDLKPWAKKTHSSKQAKATKNQPK